MIHIVCGVLLTALAVVMRLTAPRAPQLAEGFARSVFPAWSSVFAKINSAVSFSVFEYGLYALILGVLVWIAMALYRVFRQPQLLESFWRQSASTLVLLIGIISVWYMLGGGINYFRSSFAAYSGLELRPSSAEDLQGLCTDLARQAGELSVRVERDEQGYMKLSQDFDATCGDVLSGYTALSGEYGGVLAAGDNIRPKAVSVSEAMSLCRITGLYSFFTCEANINVHQPDFSIPSTIAHEAAHTCGFMREDEANYIAYIVCRGSNSSEAQYSGTLFALIHSMNALARTAPEAWHQLRATFTPEMLRDLELNATYWKQFESHIGEVADKVNDTHLKMNDQSDGIQSYGRMVDLLLADWRADGII